MCNNKTLAMRHGNESSLKYTTSPAIFMNCSIGDPSTDLNYDPNDGIPNSFSLFNVAYLCVGFVGIVGNLFACIVIAGHPPLRKRLANYFLINQSILDLVIGIMMVITSNVTLPERGTLFIVTCYFINSRILFTSVLMASTWNLAAMSLERYLEIVHPIRHKTKMKRDMVVKTLIGCWAVGIIFKIVSVLPIMRVTSDWFCIIGYYPNMAAKRAFGIATAIGEFFLPLGIIALCYFEMSKAIMKLRRQTGPTITSVSANDGRVTAPTSGGDLSISRARRNVFRIMTIVVVCFVISLGPKEICLLAYSVGLLQINLNGMLYNTCLFLNYFNCCMNPFIYLFKYEEFQRGAVSLLLRCKPRPVATAAGNSVAMKNGQRSDTSAYGQNISHMAGFKSAKPS